MRSLREHPALVHRQTLRVLVVVASLGFVVAALDGYGLWGAFSSAAEDVLGEAHEVGTLSMSFGAVLGAILVLVFTSMILRFVRFVLELDLLPRLRLEPGVDGAISGLTRYVIGAIGLLIALASLGIDTAQIALVAGALGVGIGFGLQGIVANFIAGIVLMIERPVRLGDFVEVGTLVGVVERIGLRSSTIRALDGAEVIVPNESLISREVTNWTLSDRMRRVAISVGVAYGTDPHEVLKVLRGVVDAHAGIIQLEKTRILFEAFGESSLDFKVLFWAGSIDDAMRLKSEVGVAVFDALKNAGIEIPFPQREVRVISMPDAPEPPPAGPDAERPASPATTNVTPNE
jgi:small-conductance mechanosensitive channel